MPPFLSWQRSLLSLRAIKRISMSCCIDRWRHSSRVRAMLLPMWFVPVSYASTENNKITLNVPSEFFRDQITDIYLKLIENTFEDLAGKKISFSFVINKKNNEEKDYRKASEILDKAKLSDGSELVAKKSHPDLKEEFNFDSFVVGPSNDYAYNAAVAIGFNKSSRIII